MRAVPPRRLLAESDVHRTEDVAKGTAAAVAYLAEATGRPLDDAAHLAARNGLEFLRVVMEKAGGMEVLGLGDREDVWAAGGRMGQP